MGKFEKGRLSYLYPHIDSAMFKGFVIIERVRFIGATFGDEWESVVECAAV